MVEEEEEEEDGWLQTYPAATLLESQLEWLNTSLTSRTCSVPAFVLKSLSPSTTRQVLGLWDHTGHNSDLRSGFRMIQFDSI